MAIIYMDGFDTNDSEYRMYTNFYEGWNAYQSPWGTPMSKGYFSWTWRRLDISANSNYPLLLAGMWVLRPSNDSNIIAEFINYSGNQSCRLGINVGGTIYASNWNSSSANYNSTIAPFETAGTFRPHWVEIRARYADTGGYIQIYVDGQLCINVTGDTNNGGTPSIDMIRGYNGLYLDDIVWWNDTAPGLVEASFPIGPQRIVTLRPESDNTAQFTRSTGSNGFSLIDEATPNTADYVITTTVNNLDLYNLPDLPYTPNTVNGIQIKSMALNSALSGNAAVRHVIQSNSVNYESNNIILFYNSKVNYNIYDIDPNGNTAWTPARINSLRAGFKMV